MKTNNKLKLVVLLVVVCFVSLFGTGCVAFKAGGTNKSARVDSDGSFHERHNSWDVMDPVTGVGHFLGKLVDVNCEVNVYHGGAGYAGQQQVVNNHPGSHYDYRYSRWCQDGHHIEYRNGMPWEVRDGYTK